MTRGPVALLASRVRTEEKSLMTALERRGVAFELVDARTVWRQLDGDPDPWAVVLNRELSYTRALHAATTFEALGLAVVNSARATAVCGDKWRTSLALHDAGIPTPRTALALTPEAALDALAALGYPAVIKPLVGSWGRLVTKVDTPEAAAAVLEHIAALPAPGSHVVYVQAAVPRPRRDLRIVVVGGRALGAAHRAAAGWRSNVRHGGASSWCPLTDDLADLAVAAAAAVEAEIAGVDVLEDDDGAPAVLEVNHGVEFVGFQEAMGDRVHVADRVVDHVLDRSR